MKINLLICLCAGKPSLRLPVTACNQEVVHNGFSQSPAQTPSSTPSSQSTVTSPQSPLSETFHWPDVQELRSKYTDKSACVCTVSTGLRGTRCDGCSQKYNSSSELHSTQTNKTFLCGKLSDTPYEDKCRVLEDWPQHQTRSLLCRWSSVDHVIGSLPLHEVQNLQEPVRTCAPVCKVQSEDSLLRDGVWSLSSGKSSESFRVKSLREKFQSLGSSWWCFNMRRLRWSADDCFMFILKLFPLKKHKLLSVWRHRR